MKKLVIITCTFILALSTVVYAKSVGSFKFDMATAVSGTTNFSLSKANTNVTTTANTYRYADDKEVSSKLNYSLSLHKKSAWFISYKSVGKADGTKKTTKYGKVDKSTYRVNLRVTNQNPSGTIYRYVKGSGNVNQ